MFEFLRRKQSPFVEYCRDFEKKRRSPERQKSTEETISEMMLVLFCLSAFLMYDDISRKAELKNRFKNCDADLVILLSVGLIISYRQRYIEGYRFEEKTSKTAQAIIKQSLEAVPSLLVGRFNQLTKGARKNPMSIEFFNDTISEFKNRGFLKDADMLTEILLSLAPQKEFDPMFNILLMGYVHTWAGSWSESEDFSRLAQLIDDKAV